MNLEIDKTYMTKNGRFVKINSEPWKGIYNGEYEDDGRQPSSDRWKANGESWNVLFGGVRIVSRQQEILMEDCEEARDLAIVMNLERKQKAYDKTM